MFAHARLLYHLLWIIPLAVGAVLLARRRRHRILNAFYAGDQAGNAAAEVSRTARAVRTLASIVAVVAIGLAIAGPRWGMEPTPERLMGCDVTILLDVSKSMLARDSKPDRFTFAKSLVNEFLDQLPESRIGIVAFAGTAYTAVPLTSSRDGVRLILEDLDPMSQPYGGSHLQEALTTLLEQRPTTTSAFTPVIILSDGEELSGSARSLIPKLKEAGFTLYAVGVGDPSLKTRIQLPDDTFVTHQSEPVRTGLNPEALRALAEATGGQYFHADVEPLVMEKIAAGVRSKMEVSLRSDSGMRPVERFQWALAAALGLILLRMLIGERRLLKPAMAAACLLCLPLIGSSETEDVELSAAREAVEQASDTTTRLRQTFVLAKLLQAREASGEAEALYKDVILDADASDVLRSSALQNLGAAHHVRGEAAFQDAPATAIGAFSKAMRFYRAALALRYDAGLVANLQSAGKRLAEAEAHLKQLEEKRARKRKAIEQLIDARDSQARAAAQPTVDDDNERALKMTVQGGKTAEPLKIPKLAETVEAAVSLQRKFRDASELVERRTHGTDALGRIVDALRLLGVRDPKNEKKPPEEGDSDQPPKGDWKKGEGDLPEGLRILRELAKKERDDRRELMKEADKGQRVGRGEVKDW